MAARTGKGGRYMRKKLAIILTVGLLGAWAAGAAWGQVVARPLVAPPVIQVQPLWQPIPRVSGVQYVPTLRQDLFRYHNNYYCWHDGRWFQGQNHSGPGRWDSEPPASLYSDSPQLLEDSTGLGSWPEGRLARPATAPGADEKATAASKARCHTLWRRSGGPALPAGSGGGSRGD